MDWDDSRSTRDEQGRVVVFCRDCPFRLALPGSDGGAEGTIPAAGLSPTVRCVLEEILREDLDHFVNATPCCNYCGVELRASVGDSAGGRYVGHRDECLVARARRELLRADARPASGA